ncbi:RNA-binding protein, putative [Plasmodium knowlesi strain H]|uniref:RNA-binding protein, putative n=3 Tax=Plasmodium knowlesi TaxID=5850 RepID=A0A5K1UKR2_PLAKH|nr:multiple RNA-binding domain-containing protein 1, putative [Plasmodium knowlesi strain H]OTN63871.1 putative RNA binding protein [Plasmodium knowlesi]CAA9990964.1 multiple RNA-binding domain-containing protein 1, putative [Plasmodium knowlesi strain H]SBO20802.1 RNA-binding protein, putative [Plasmodium knowlesi strain H]SBO21235.1 RNA-binding protein, putative [Plasmodium knowlesi strain H]VVS80438.1 multiple RNA-binding domain-containing protein 1, putative [Plasmodium knowlesi strain H]|eukprot:XP_002262247.1 RNA binding protein, putative [Plasmodium knowlesi strain H]
MMDNAAASLSNMDTADSNCNSRPFQNESNFDKTRLIIKNIPKYMNEMDLKKHFFKMKGNYEFKITDIKIMKRKKIVKNKEIFESRKICFIGFINNTDCENFKKSFNNTYINTSKIVIEDAFSPLISKNAQQSRNATSYALKRIGDIQKMKKDKSVKIVKSNNFVNKTIPIKKTKAGMSTTRSHMIFLDDQPVQGEVKEEEKKKKKKKKKKKEKKKIKMEGDNPSERLDPAEKTRTNGAKEEVDEEGNRDDAAHADTGDDAKSNAENEEAEEEGALDWLKKISKREESEINNHSDKNDQNDKGAQRNRLFEDEMSTASNLSSDEKEVKKKEDNGMDDENCENMNTGKIIIFNLPPVSEQDVKNLCERFGPVVDVKVFRNVKKGAVVLNLNEKKNNKSSDDFFIKLLKENHDSFANEKVKEKKKKKKKVDEDDSGVEKMNDRVIGDGEAEDWKNKNRSNKNESILNSDLTNVKVYAFVNFMFPSACERAKQFLNHAIFRGKVLSVKYAKEKIGDYEYTEKEKNNVFIKLSHDSKTSYKKILEIQKKRNCQNENIWNILYTDINSSIHSFCKENKCSPNSILNIKDRNIAVNVSLTETYIINKMKEWIKKEGIYLEAFEQIYRKRDEGGEPSGETDGKTDGDNPPGEEPSHTNHVVKYKRSDDTIIVKNLSIQTNQKEVISLFKKYGVLSKVSFSPYNNIAILQFEKAENAKKAFISNSYIRYKKLPLYLEWAPMNLFQKKENQDGDGSSNKGETKSGEIPAKEAVKKSEQEGAPKEEQHYSESESSDEEITHASIYVKNLNFNTKEEDLKKLFEKLEGFITCNIVKSKKAISKKNDEKGKEPEQKLLSQGYGFVEFKSKELALEAIKKLTATTLDGHVLELSLSRNRVKKKKNKNNEEKEVVKEKKKITKKLLVKNLAFQVTKEELRKLFSAFGNIKSVRIPKNAYNRSRGYAFVEFMSKNECLTAIESLQHTHLYGRHLIIDFADDFIFDKNVNEFDKMKEEGVNNNNGGKKEKCITSEQAKRKATYEKEKKNQVTESKRRKVMNNMQDI